MFALAGILEAVRPLESGPTLDDLVADVRHWFGGLSHHLTLLQGPSLRITRSPTVLASVTHALDAWRSERGDDEAVLLARTLREPIRVFRARAAGPGHHGFVLVGCFSVGDATRIAILDCEQSAARHRDGQALVVRSGEIVDGSDALGGATRLAAVYARTADARGAVLKAHPRLLVLGGDRRANEDRVRGVAAAAGFRADLFGDPESNLARAVEAIGDRRDLVAIWQGGMPHRPNVHDALAQAARRRAVPSVQLSSRSPDDLPDELLLELLDHDREPPVVSSMTHALEIARLTCPHLTFVSEAETAAGASPFWRPRDVLRGMQFADDVVRRWRHGDLPAGIDAAFSESGFGYASNISRTARNRYGQDYRVRYGDAFVTLGPHLKFGKGSPERCARVYWYIDDDAKTFVVGHVGRHLRDDTG